MAGEGVAAGTHRTVYDRILLPRNFFPHKIESVLLYKFR